MNQRPVLETKLDQSQQLLLKAILCEEADALEAWEMWRGLIDLDHLEDGSFRLLPSLYCRMHTLGVSDALIARLRNIYQHTWYKNHILLNTLATVWPAFESAGIPYYAIDDLAVLLAAYGDPGIRPLNSVDILVPSQSTAKALSLLPQLGWQPVTTPRLSTQGMKFTHPTGCSLNLHQRLYLCSPFSQLSEPWPAEPVIRPTSSQAALLPSPWQVVGACLYLAPWILHPAPVAVLDVQSLIKAWEPDDWDALAHLAQRYQCTLPVLAVLRLLTAWFGINIPVTVCTQLERCTTDQERRFYQLSLRSAPAANLWVKWRIFKLLPETPSGWQSCLRFPSYLWKAHYRKPMQL